MPEHRIVLTGASGVGKTTLAQLLAQILDCELIPELARKICLDRGFQMIGEIPDQEGYKRECLVAQIEAENAARCFVADRGVIDIWVLWQRWNICNAMSYDTEAVYDKVRAQAQSYSHIVYLPPAIEAEEDGFRWTDADYRKQIDRLVKMSVFELGLLDRMITVQSTDPAERLQEVLAALPK